jgi:outer membrane protein TolC
MVFRFLRPTHLRRPYPSPVSVCLYAFFSAWCVLEPSPARAAGGRDHLFLSEVLESVKSRYPPYLAALIEQDIANGSAREALGQFDLTLSVDGFANPAGYYDGSGARTLLTQPLPFGGATVFGGYRLSSGFLPNYNKDRTGEDGQAILGFNVPLLQGARIDKNRAELWKASIDQELADPIILRQYLDFIRAATISYYAWLAAGQRLALAEEVLQVAKDRDLALAEQIARGASAPIVRVDNRGLVVSREIGVVQALRRFQATAIELSLFHRDRESGEPLVASRFEVPGAFPAPATPKESKLQPDLASALARRPEIRRIDLLLEKRGIDLRLAKEGLLPKLNVGVEASQAVDGTRPNDIEKTEIDATLRFSLPLQRREAQGQIQQIEGEAGQLSRQREFASDRITADVMDSFSALVAAYDGIGLSSQNVDLADQLEKAQLERLEEGVTDLLALQLREKAAYDARQLEVEARAAYFRALADYEAAVAVNAPAALLP